MQMTKITQIDIHNPMFQMSYSYNPGSYFQFPQIYVQQSVYLQVR